MSDNRSSVTTDDIGAPVLDTDDTQVGTIAAVEGEVVFIRPEPTVDDDARARGSFGWADPEAEHPVDTTAVERVDDASEPTFRIDLGELRGGEAADEHLATGGPERDDRRGRER